MPYDPTRVAYPPAERYARTAGRLSALRELRAELNAALLSAAECLPAVAYGVLDAFQARLDGESEAAMSLISYYPTLTAPATTPPCTPTPAT